MSELVRFGVSLEDDLLNKFDRHIKKQKYTNRSEAIRDLIREDDYTDEIGHQFQMKSAIVSGSNKAS